MDIAELKRLAWEANLELNRRGLVLYTWGNVSQLDGERGVFAIKPSGVDYDVLKADDIVVLDYEGNVVEGSLRPSSDTPTHRRLFQAFPEIRAVVHTHSRHATAWAQSGRGLPCLGTTHADFFYGEVPITRALTADEVRGEYEWETGNVIVERFRDLDPQAITAVLVKNHGPFTWGPSGRKAVETALALEIVAEMNLKTMQINPAAEPAPQYLLDKHYLRKHGASATYGQK